MKKTLSYLAGFIVIFTVTIVLLSTQVSIGSGNWDLTSPVNNSYIASFPALVRANQAAIVASLTPPIEWTGEGADGYGTASAKLGFISTAGSNDIPAFWLGCLHDADDEDPLVRYFLGPQLAVPGDVAFGEYSGFDILVASDTEPSIFIIPPWNNWPTNGFIRLRQSSLYIGGNLKVSGVATGTVAQDAVNVGQLGASISYAIDVYDNFLTASLTYKSNINDGYTTSGIPVSLKEDIGYTWVLASDTPEATINCMRYCGNGIVLAGGSSNGLIIRSTDYGAAWSQSLDQLYDTISCIEYCGNGIVLAGANDTFNGVSCIFRSTDYGVTWDGGTDIFGGPGQIYDIKYCGDGVVSLFYNSISVYFKSTDYGANWVPGTIDGGISKSTYCGNGVILGGTSIIYRSDNKGTTWTNVLSLPGNSHLTAIEYCGNSIAVAVMYDSSSGDSKIYRSVDNGVAWTLVDDALSIVNECFTNCGNGMFIVGATNGAAGILLRSFDYGENWIGYAAPITRISSIVHCGNGIVALGSYADGYVYSSKSFVNW